MTEYMTPAESNDEARRRARRTGTPSVLRRQSPKEGTMQVKIPLWLDRPYIRRVAAELGISQEEARRRIEEEERT